MLTRLSKWRTPLAYLLLLWLFYVATKGAYRGFFDSDDLDNLAWTRIADWHGFATGLFTPWFYSSNFRPIGHFFFWAMGRIAGLDYPPYVAVAHLVHAANMSLLWALLRRLQFSWAAQIGGVILFAFHMGAFDAYWKPMYIFDLTCALFSLAAILLWVNERRILSFIAFWLAYKCKELAIAIPFALLAYEYLLAKSEFRRLAPFLLTSVWFTSQALISQAGKSGDYAIRLTPTTLWQTITFYASKILLVPYAGFALLILPSWVRDRRLWFGLLSALLFLAPMFAVPGRLNGAYLYLPLAGLAIATAALIERADWRVAAALGTIWLSFQYIEMRKQRAAFLADSEELRAYVYAVARLAKEDPKLDTFLIDSTPKALRMWGIEGALRYTFQKEDLRFLYQADPAQPKPAADANFALLNWDPAGRRLFILKRTAAAGDAPYLEMTALTPVWQLQEGWYQLEPGGFRWTMPKATATLRRPENANRFQITVNISPAYIQAQKVSTLIVRLDGQEIGRKQFTRNGWITESFPLEPRPGANVQISFEVDPPFRPGKQDPRLLGIPIAAFGFR